MSVHVLSWVLRNSPATLAARLVLIVLADHAGHDGTNAFPSVATIAHEARLDLRTARRALRRLEQDGLIRWEGNSGYGTRNYTVVTDLGKFQELPPLNNSSSLGGFNGSIDGLGGIECLPRDKTAPRGQIAPPSG